MSSKANEIVSTLVQLGVLKSAADGGVEFDGVKLSTASGNTVLVGPDGVEFALSTFPQAYLFGGLPSPATVVIGETYYVSDVGQGGSYWFSDGTSWRVVGGSITLLSERGTVASPLASLAGASPEQFFNVSALTIPAGVISPTTSKLRVETYLRRSGATGTGVFTTRFGKTGLAPILSHTVAATDGVCFRAFHDLFPGNGTAFSTNLAGINASAVGAFTDITNEDFDTLAAQTIKHSVTSANAADTFQLLARQITLWP